MSFFGNRTIQNNFKIAEETFTATEGQSTFTLINTYELNKNRVNVFVDGIPQFSPENFTETSTNSITLSEPLTVGTKVKVEIFRII